MISDDMTAMAGRCGCLLRLRKCLDISLRALDRYLST